MKLIKVEFTGAPAGPDKNKLVLTAAQIQLAGIQTDTVKEEIQAAKKQYQARLPQMKTKPKN